MHGVETRIRAYDAFAQTHTMGSVLETPNPTPLSPEPTCDVDQLAKAELRYLPISHSVSDMVQAGLEQWPLRTALRDLALYHMDSATHSIRVAGYVGALSEHIGLSPEEAAINTEASLCHDVGKLDVSTGLLDAPRRLTDEEHEDITRHPVRTFVRMVGLYALAQQMGWSENPERDAAVARRALGHHLMTKPRDPSRPPYPSREQRKQLEKMGLLPDADILFDEEHMRDLQIIGTMDVYDAVSSNRKYLRGEIEQNDHTKIIGAVRDSLRRRRNFIVHHVCDIHVERFPDACSVAAQLVQKKTQQMRSPKSTGKTASYFGRPRSFAH